MNCDTCKVAMTDEQITAIHLAAGHKIAPSYGRAVCYAKDAMTGLRLMNLLMDPKERETTLRAYTYTEAAASTPASVWISFWPRKSGSRRRSPAWCWAVSRPPRQGRRRSAA